MGTRIKTGGRTKTAPTSRVGVKEGQVARNVTTATELALTEIQQAYLDDSDLIEQEPDSVEVDALEDSGDSEAMLTGILLESVGDAGFESRLPTVRQLPSSARPPVRYLIDESFEVRRLDSASDMYSNLSHLIASAIARHLRNSDVTLATLGDWRHVPAIGSDEALRKLINDELDQKHEMQLAADMKRYGARAKEFAVILPNGDTVAAQTLITRAQTGMLATDGGFLRSNALLGNDSTLEIAGEVWTSKNISGFRKKIDERKRKQKTGANSISKIKVRG